MLTPLSSCRRSLSTLAGQAPVWWWWNCLERFVSRQHGKQMKDWRRRVDKQNNGSRTHPSRIMFFFFYSAFHIFQKETERLAHKPLFLSLVDMPTHWGGLVQIMERTAHSTHSSHSQPIKNFHRLGWAGASAKPLLYCFVILRFLKHSVYVCNGKSYILSK